MLQQVRLQHIAWTDTSQEKDVSFLQKGLGMFKKSAIWPPKRFSFPSKLTYPMQEC